MMFDEGESRVPVIRVKREGSRGWKWINATAFDPRVHDLYEYSDPGLSDTQHAPRRRGRPPKVQVEQQAEQLQGDES